MYYVCLQSTQEMLLNFKDIKVANLDIPPEIDDDWMDWDLFHKLFQGTNGMLDLYCVPFLLILYSETSLQSMFLLK